METTEVAAPSNSLEWLAQQAQAKASAPAPTEEKPIEEEVIVETTDESSPEPEKVENPTNEPEVDDWRVQEEEESPETQSVQSDWDDLNQEYGWKLNSTDDVKTHLRSLLTEKDILAKKQDDIKNHLINSDVQAFAEVLRGTDSIIAAHLDNPKAATEEIRNHLISKLSPFLTDPSTAPKTELAKYALMTTKYKGLPDAATKASEHLEMLAEDAVDSLADIGLNAANAQLQAQRDALLSETLKSYKDRQAEKSLHQSEVEKAIDGIPELDGGFKLKFNTRSKDGKIVTVDGNANLKRMFQDGKLNKLNLEAYRGSDGKIDYKSYALDAARLINFKDVAAVAASRGKSEANKAIIKEAKNIQKPQAQGGAGNNGKDLNKNEVFLQAMESSFGKKK